jgi:hypothetical protein
MRIQTESAQSSAIKATLLTQVSENYRLNVSAQSVRFGGRQKSVQIFTEQRSVLSLGYGFLQIDHHV